MKVAIRVDGSLFIGMGHVIRSLALGSAFRRGGHEVVYFSRFEPGISRLRSAGFMAETFCAGLPDGPGKEYEPAKDGEALRQLLAVQEFDCLVTDSYRVDESYFAAVRSAVPVSVYVDDLNRFPADVDGLINGNINAEALGYEKWPVTVRRWLGCRYNLLRADFRDLPTRTTSTVVRTILLTGGGGDSGPVLAFLAQCLLDSPIFAATCLEMVAPSQSIADADLTDLSQRYPRQVRLHRDVTDMAALMQQCDLAISAGGTTLYELCAVGAPRIAYVLASNQRGIVEEMARQELAINLGQVMELKPVVIVGAVAELVGDLTRRDLMSRRGRELVDGKGADRLVSAIEEVASAVGGTRI
ncbi:MAG TPA: UDP-2,4-diacetamido-2,4,6-trideoxy-beta-L-altropyranose hydrolase [Negativicutes bacterium]|nr:UDP-2,4-diacetamido-2,4,6-trideoxy-beta-L-altropyranose hydrolase [Negativicutes bacterium]